MKVGHYDPWTTAHEKHKGIHIALAPIAPARAAWVPTQRVILVEKTLSYVEGRCVLAHELAHIELGHRHRDAPWFDTRQEHEADLLAARNLIDIRTLAAALVWSRVAAEVAESLSVDRHTLRTRITHLHPSERHLIFTRIQAEPHIA